MKADDSTLAHNLYFTERSRVKVINLVCGISAGLAFTSAYIGMDSAPYGWSLVTLGSIFIVSLLLNLNSRTTLAKYFVPLATTIWITYMCIAFGSRLGTQNYLVIALVALAIYANKRTYRVISILTVIATAVFVNVYQAYHPPIYPLPRLIEPLAVVNVLTPLIIISMICWNILTDATKANAIIDQQRQDLADSNQFKDKVLSILGHDMRSPFNSAKSLLYLMENQMMTPEQQQQFLEQLHADIDLSLQTLENILEWASQAYYGSVINAKIVKENLDVHAMIESTIASFSHLAEKKQVSLVSEIAEGNRAFADRQQIAFVLRNLTSNALKFSHKNQQVTFTSAEKDGKVVLSIQDNGVGMSPDRIAALFQIDNRSSEKGTANEKGSGMGLIFCKEFIENNEGELWITSERNQGTVVNFSLLKRHH